MTIPPVTGLLGDLIVGLDHVGIAVTDLDAAIDWYAGILGARLVHREVNEEQAVAEAMLTVGDRQAQVQLLASTAPDSPIGRFIAQRGPGLQQVAVRVRDIEESMRRLAAAGVALVDAEPRRGTAGSRIAFLHPRATGGVLIELVEQAG